MKKYAFLAATLLAFTTLSPAQTTAVPNFISYQGRVVDAGGNNVGAGTPVNRTVIFRIWDNPSSTNAINLIYSESQNVTVSEGEFSVLVGQGVANLTQTFGYSETAKKTDLAAAFNGSTRYLGVTVAAAGTIATTDNEITPRQQIVSTAFAMRSKVAETVITNAIGTGNIANTSITLVKMAEASVDSSKIKDLSIATVDLANASVTAAKLGADVGLWSVNGTNRYYNGGNVGIGTSTPLARLHAKSSSHVTALIDGSSTVGTWLELQNTSVGGKIWQLISSGSGNGEGPGKLMFVAGSSSGVGSRNIMTLLPTGNVGIGTASPTSAKLVISGAVGTEGLDLATTDQYANLRVLRNSLNSADKDMYIGLGSGVTSSLHLYSNNTETITVKGNKVGIGTSSPTQAKLVVNGVGGTDTIGNHASFLASGAVNPATGTFNTNDVSIKATHAVHAAYFRAVSDARIKSIKGRSDGAADLAMLTGIEITDYTHKDVIEHGNRPQKKVIGQQIQQVFPQAVSLTTEVVPDIYAKATQQDGWVQLATDLKLGDRVRLIGEKEEGIHEVLEVREGAFRTAFKPATDKVFVFGREVKDFRSVDYEAISMLNVSATQELKREKDEEIQALRNENSELRDLLAAQEKRLTAMDAADKASAAKLAAIEAMLSADQPALRTVSLKTAE